MLKIRSPRVKEMRLLKGVKFVTSDKFDRSMMLVKMHDILRAKEWALRLLGMAKKSGRTEVSLRELIEEYWEDAREVEKVMKAIGDLIAVGLVSDLKICIAREMLKYEREGGGE